jgi:hypothetical protein
VLVLAVLALAAVAAPSKLIEAASTLPPAASQMRLRIPFSLTRGGSAVIRRSTLVSGGHRPLLTPGLRRVTNT